MKRYEKAIPFFGMLLLLVFFMYFFVFIHPLVVYDSDDWQYVTSRRNAWPELGLWNPAKVFPETFMPLISDFGAHFIRPVIGDYITSLTIAYALTGSLFIVFLFCEIYILISQKFQISSSKAVVACGILFIMCFSIYRNDWTQNSYMFWARNVNCFFNYILPGLLNAILVVLLMHKDIYEFKGLKLGVIITAVWLAIFSNLFHSVILAVYMFSRIILSVGAIKNGVKDFIRKHWFELAVLVMWAVAMVFEKTGGRASASEGFRLNQLFNTIKEFIIAVVHLNKLTVLFVMVLIIVAVVQCVADKKISERECYIWHMKECCISGFLTMVYLILLCSVVDSEYIKRTDVIFGITFYLLLITGISLAFVMQKNNYFLAALPIVAYALVCNLLYAGRVYKESNEMRIFPEKCVQVDNYLIDQVVEADCNGQSKVELHVPVGVDGENWPHAIYMGGRFANTLYQHGIISKYIEIDVIPDKTINEKFHLGY